MKKVRAQAGFTLIELIMVIVILGVLSAFALPRFADLGGNAREASANGLAASVRAAANIAHAQWLADGNAAATVTLEGQSIDMVDGYPQANAAGIGAAAQVLATDYGAAGGGVAAGDTITYDVPGASGTCTVAYQAATTPGVPVVTVNTAGCN